MNTKTKKTLLILAIILLVVINISALLTIIYNNKIQSTPPPPAIEGNNLQNEIEVRGMYRFLKDELKLSDDQFAQFQEINRENMMKSREIALELSNKRREMMSEIAKKNPNREILDTYAHEIGTLHYELKKLTINHFIELKEICNEDQQEVLQKLFMQLIDDQEQQRFRRNPGERGRNRHGRQHGRN